MVAFIVYFWSQYLNGTSGWLEVMLFIAGVICVAAEIFVLPGFGVLGLGGGLLVIASIVLASQSFVLPVNEYQIRQMQWSLIGILGAAAGVATLGILLRRWLPSTPILRNVVLEPPADDGLEDTLNELVGCVGTTTTRLAPAGKARIGESVRDVASDGPLIEPGTAVRVVGVRGGRVIVHPAGDA
jgi:membrane-bound serine protease (ClpP class)